MIPVKTMFDEKIEAAAQSLCDVLFEAKEPMLRTHPKNEKLTRDIAAVFKKSTGRDAEVVIDEFQDPELIGAMDWAEFRFSKEEAFLPKEPKI